MRYNPEIHHRRSIRLKGYDYTQPGAYFITVCIHGRECILGTIAQGEIIPGVLGEIVAACWRDLPSHHLRMQLDAFVVMPNHVHGIVVITQRRGEASFEDASPLQPPPQPATRPNGTRPGSLAAMIQNFKSVSARRINASRGTPGAAVWQRNYYERIVRSDEELNRIRQYILDNPAKWSEDTLNPDSASMSQRHGG